MSARKPAAALRPGDRFLPTTWRELPLNAVQRVLTVDHTIRLGNGIVRVFYGRYGLNSIDAAGTHRFDLALSPSSTDEKRR